MTGIDGLLARVRAGEIVHMRSPAMFAGPFRTLTDRVEQHMGISAPLSGSFDTLNRDRVEPSLGALVRDLDDSGEHLRQMAVALMSQGGISEHEGMLQITLGKSMRFCLTESHKQNYGYFAHRDSWFDLSPDSVNIVLYLTDVPAHGNTQFYTDYFTQNAAYDPETRRLRDESSLTRVTAFNCKAADVLIFSGDHLHSGALCETNRLSVEFRLSRRWEFGRPECGIVYRPLSDFVAPVIEASRAA